MIETILKTTEGSQTVSLPLTWAEVTFEQYVNVVTSEPVNQIPALLGIDADLWHALDIDTKARVDVLLSFIGDAELLASLCKPCIHSINPAALPWGKLEKAKQILSKYLGKYRIYAAAELLELYTGKDIRKLPITESYNDVDFFLSISTRFWNCFRHYLTMN